MRIMRGTGRPKTCISSGRGRLAAKGANGLLRASLTTISLDKIRIFMGRITLRAFLARREVRSLGEASSRVQGQQDPARMLHFKETRNGAHSATFR